MYSVYGNVYIVYSVYNNVCSAYSNVYSVYNVYSVNYSGAMVSKHGPCRPPPQSQWKNVSFIQSSLYTVYTLWALFTVHCTHSVWALFSEHYIYCGHYVSFIVGPTIYKVFVQTGLVMVFSLGNIPSLVSPRPGM